MDLQSSRVSSRGLFSINNERFLKRNLNVDKQDVCETHEVYVQVQKLGYVRIMFSFCMHSKFNTSLFQLLFFTVVKMSVRHS